MSTVKIPPVLRSSTRGAKEVEADGRTVRDVLRSLAEQHPATQSQLFSEEGDLNRYVNVYLNDEDVRVLDGLDTNVGDGDTLVILPAMAGGTSGQLQRSRSGRGTFERPGLGPVAPTHRRSTDLRTQATGS